MNTALTLAISQPSQMEIRNVRFEQGFVEDGDRKEQMEDEQL